LKSNGIALVRQTESGCLDLVGAGMGQPNRVDCIRLLAGPRYLGKKINSAEIILASDAFFPFADNVEEAFKLGIKKIVQPGGSIRDQEVIDAANRLGVAMAFTGRRHFRH
jgi:phosphoribosylaminoimidazolecarboxamide formyltransferase/IMP cyclohydrolase